MHVHNAIMNHINFSYFKATTEELLDYNMSINFAVYLEQLILTLKDLGIGCHFNDMLVESSLTAVSPFYTILKIYHVT